MQRCLLQYLRFALVASLLSLAACASRESLAALPECTSCMTLSADQLAPFTDQDSTTGALAVTPQQLTLSGNRWLRTSASFDITPTTRLRFWFRSSEAAELQMIGVSASATTVNNHFIKLTGSQSWARNAPYSGNGDWQFYDLPIGEWASGSGRYLVFANDNDTAPTRGIASWGNLQLIDTATGSSQWLGNGELLQINSGSDTNLDSGTDVWLADQFHYGASRSQQSLNGEAPFTSARECSDGYAVPLINGRYRVELLFSEDGQQVTAAGQRLMTVSIEEQAAEPLDIFAAAGGADRPFSISREVTISDGQLDVRLAATEGCTRINGLRLTTLSLNDQLAAGYLFSGPARASGAALRAEPTFEAVGLYWRPAAASNGAIAEVRYRKVGDSQWRQGHPLWLDERSDSELYDVPERAREFRGSIVGLAPNSRYDVQVYLPATGEMAHQSFSTWSDEPPIAATTTVTSSSEPLLIQQSGSASGWLLYTAAEGGATLDGNGVSDVNIDIDGSYIIIRGLTLKNARMHSIRLSKKSHHIIIEHNDISGWGRIDSDGFGVNYDSAITNGPGISPQVSHLVIQHNDIHHPRSGANNWRQFRPKYNTDHPLGPQAISLWDTGGHHVIRHNRIYSSPGYYFNDGIGGGNNFSYSGGAPGNDSDIYGNEISHCWDEAIEAEGGNANVRIWDNFTDQVFVHYGLSATTVGPLYLFRNVAYRAKRSDIQNDNAGVSVKAKGTVVNDRLYGNGKVYLFHNSFYRTAFRVGTLNGIYDSGGLLSNMTSRNNIFDHEGWAIDDSGESSNDFDYDLYQGPLITASGQQANGINQPPLNDLNNDQQWRLLPESPATDAGMVVPNFSDGYQGAAPDIGAVEHPSQ